MESYRSTTMKEYGLMIEYKHLEKHVPSGIYILPSFENPRKWYGVIFLRRGWYAKGVFKFRIDVPKEYNDINTLPTLTFSTSVYNPYVNEKVRRSRNVFYEYYEY